jgi:putative two-component system response regulator
MIERSPYTVLIVDDSPENLYCLNELLKPQYRILAANSGKECLRLLQGANRPHLILLDVMMPEMDGFTVFKKLRTTEETKDIPVIFLTAMIQAKDEEYGLDLGAEDYITKPIRPLVVLARVRMQLELSMARQSIKTRNAQLEAKVQQHIEENDMIQRASIRALAHLAEMRDPETGNHILRTQGYVRLLASKLQNHPRFSATLSPSYIDILSQSAPLHDIGKVGIPDYILCKPGKLTPDEWVIMKTHAKRGSDAIEMAEHDLEMSLPFLVLAKEISHWHHEKWDGSGYPDGLQGDAIPISARLMAIADVFDALISVRVYKPAMPPLQAQKIISDSRGSHFDPDMTDIFIEHYDEFVAIAEQYREV